MRVMAKRTGFVTEADPSASLRDDKSHLRGSSRCRGVSIVLSQTMEAVVRAINQTTEINSLGRGQTNQLPSLIGASWELPNKATREFALPVKTTGAQLLAAVRSSDEFVISTAEMLLAHEAKMQADKAQS